MRLLFTLFLFFACLIGNAQYQDRQATLTNRNGDVMQGTVRYYDWNENPASVVFTNAVTGHSRPVNTESIKQLSIHDGPVYGGLYLGLPIYAKYPITFSHELIQRIDSTYYLAELLIDSEPVKLYQIFDADNKARFVLSKADSLIILNDIHTQLVKQGAVFSYDVPEYRKTLKRVLNECPTLNTDNTTYTEKGLIDVVKDYITFCRIDARIYSEKKKTSKVIFGVGGFGSSWRTGEGRLDVVGLSVQFLMPKQFHNTFALIDLGLGAKDGPFAASRLQIGVYGGKYFGTRSIQLKVYTGLSTVLGPLDTGVGISYRKMVSAEIRYPFFLSMLSGFKESENTFVRPLFNVRAVLPLGKRDRN